MRSEHPELARPAKRCLGALDTVSWPWIPVLGSLEPPRRDGENAQKTGKNGEKMGEIRPKTCEGVGITWFHVTLKYSVLHIVSWWSQPGSRLNSPLSTGWEGMPPSRQLRSSCLRLRKEDEQSRGYRPLTRAPSRAG